MLTTPPSVCNLQHFARPKLLAREACTGKHSTPDPEPTGTNPGTKAHILLFTAILEHADPGTKAEPTGTKSGTKVVPVKKYYSANIWFLTLSSIIILIKRQGIGTNAWNQDLLDPVYSKWF